MDDLYFFRTRAGPLKVGRSRNVPARLRTIQSSCPDRVECIGILPGCGWQEAIWHDALADRRLRGEWFHCDSDVRRALRLAMQGRDWWEPLQPPRDYLCERLDPALDIESEEHDAAIAEIADDWQRDMARMVASGPVACRLRRPRPVASPT